MAASHLQPQHIRRHRRPNFFDTFGYGSRPQKPSSFVTLLVSLSVIFHLGMLPILWVATPGIPSIVWTGTSASLLFITTLAARHSSISVRWTTVFAVAFFIAYPLFGWVSYKVWGQSSGEREDLLLGLIPVMFLGMVLYFVGAAARSHRVYRALSITWLIIAAYAVFNARNLDMQGLSDSSSETGVKLSYQLMGDAFAICSTILAPRIRNAFWQWIFILVAIGVAFVIPSRSAAMFAAVALLSIPFMSSSMTMRVMVLIVAACFFAGYKTGTLATWFEGSRFESVFTPDEQDSSWQIRQEITDKGLMLITNRPFTGEWAFQLSDLKFAGFYMHNALDIWAQTGLIPFLLFMSIWATLLGALVTGLERWPRIARETVPALMFAAMSWALSRNVSFVALFFCLGFASAALAQARFGHAVRRHRASEAFRHSQFDTQFSHSQFGHSQFGYTQYGQGWAQQGQDPFQATRLIDQGVDGYGQQDAYDPQGGYDPQGAYLQDAHDPQMGVYGPQDAYDPQQAAYAPQDGYPQGTYDPQPGYYDPQGGYPQGEYDPQQGYYDPQGMYDPQQGAYDPQGTYPQGMYDPQPGAYEPRSAFPQGMVDPQPGGHPQGAHDPQQGAYPQAAPVHGNYDLQNALGQLAPDTPQAPWDQPADPDSLGVPLTGNMASGSGALLGTPGGDRVQHGTRHSQNGQPGSRNSRSSSRSGRTGSRRF